MGSICSTHGTKVKCIKTISKKTGRNRNSILVCHIMYYINFVRDFVPRKEVYN
jgi:hypothetical protein